MRFYSRNWTFPKNVLPTDSNMSENFKSKTCVPTYATILSTRYFSGSSSRSAAVTPPSSGSDNDRPPVGLSAADLFTRTPGANSYVSAASNNPSTMSISLRTLLSSSAVFRASVVSATVAAQHTATADVSTITAATRLNTVIVRSRCRCRCRCRCCYRIVTTRQWFRHAEVVWSSAESRRGCHHSV